MYTHEELKDLVGAAVSVDGYDCFDQLLGKQRYRTVTNPADPTRPKTVKVRGNYIWADETICHSDVFAFSARLDQTLRNYVYANLDISSDHMYDSAIYTISVCGWKLMSDTDKEMLAEDDDTARKRAREAAERARIDDDMRRLADIARRNPQLLRDMRWR